MHKNTTRTSHLSPYFFLLIVGGLSKLIFEEHRCKRLIKISFQGHELLIDSLFVDAILFFFMQSKRECQRIKETLDMFCQETGMEINQLKYSIHLLRYHLDQSPLWRNYFPFEVVNLEEGIKYLGFNLKPME